MTASRSKRRVYRNTDAHTCRHLAINQLPTIDQPGYRINHCDPTALSSVELILLVTRCRHLDTAAAVIEHAGGLLQLINVPAAELEALEGIGPSAVNALKAALELGRRATTAAPVSRATCA